MSTEQKDLEQNALASWLSRTWLNFKQGKLISYKLMALILIVTAAVGVWAYISYERKKANSRRWIEFEEATTAEKLEDLAKRHPETPLAAYSLLGVARARLGLEGIDVVNSPRIEKRAAAVENIEKARKAFGELLKFFADDVVGRAECYLGLAKAEMALVAVPEKPDDLTKFKGDVSKVVEYLDEFLKIVPNEIPLAKDTKRLADALRNEQSADPKERLPAEEFKRVQRSLYELRGPLPGLPGGPEPVRGPGPSDGPPPVTVIPGGK